MKFCTVVRRLAPCLVACVFWLGNPAESNAIFHWFSNCCSPPPAYTYGYAGPFCNSGVQVNYLPTTAYRTTYVNVPVTTMRTCATVDPCTGCQVTAMRPVTTIVAQPRLVPYNTYRLVYSAPVRTYYAPAASCCTSTAGYAPAYSNTYASPAPVEQRYVEPAQPTIDSRGYERAEPAYDDRGAYDSDRSAPRSRRTFVDEEPASAAETKARKEPIHIGPDDDQDVHSDSGYRRRIRPRDDESDDPVLVNPNNKTARRGAVKRSRTTARPASTAAPQHRAPRRAPRREPVEDDGWRPSNR